MRYIKRYEKIIKFKRFYLLPTKGFEESLNKTDIEIKDKILADIINSNMLSQNKYIYIGIYLYDGDKMDWQWCPFELYDGEGYFEDGYNSFIDAGYKFVGYDNLTPDELEEVEEMRNLIKIKMDVKKYNL